MLDEKSAKRKRRIREKIAAKNWSTFAF